MKIVRCISIDADIYLAFKSKYLNVSKTLNEIMTTMIVENDEYEFNLKKSDIIIQKDKIDNEIKKLSIDRAKLLKQEIVLNEQEKLIAKQREIAIQEESDYISKRQKFLRDSGVSRRV